MSKSARWLAAGPILCCLGLAATASDAAVRTFIGSTGTDSGTCTRAAPCRNLAYAFTQTSAGGEIYILDSAGYGSLTVTRSISIVNDGDGTAGVSGAAAGTAMTISAGPTDIVHLRGLSFDGAGTAANGLLFSGGGNLDVANCVFRHFTSVGLAFAPSGSTTSSFSVADSIASDNGSTGIYIAPSASQSVEGVINHVAANHNTSYGIYVYHPNTSGTIDVSVVDSVASNNGDGVAEDTSIVRLARSVITGNGTDGVYGNGGTFYSYGDNDINGNGTDVPASTLTVATTQ